MVVIQILIDPFAVIFCECKRGWEREGANMFSKEQRCKSANTTRLQTDRHTTGELMTGIKDEGRRLKLIGSARTDSDDMSVMMMGRMYKYMHLNISMSVWSLYAYVSYNWNAVASTSNIDSDIGATWTLNRFMHICIEWRTNKGTCWYWYRYRCLRILMLVVSIAEIFCVCKRAENEREQTCSTRNRGI
jgi:hypothetical protein